MSSAEHTPGGELPFGLSVAPGGGTPKDSALGDAAALPARRTASLDELVAGVIAGDRAMLGRAISVVESRHPAHAATAQALLTRLLPRAGGSMRVGVTGVPGAGKSTFIERLGLMLTGRGCRVAVLAVDPSSGVSGGSVMGDKTRMARLSADTGAFIRPSPSGGTLGGVARRTRETILVCEAAGFDVVLVETVGVGQSETVVAEMTDFFLAVMIAGAGDELQGIKRGLLELVDLIVVNKADGDNVNRARAAARQYATALHMVARRDPTWDVPVETCSAVAGLGVSEVWAHVERRISDLRADGRLPARRREQDLRWLHALVRERIDDMLQDSRRARAAVHDAETSVRAGDVPVSLAAERVVEALLTDLREAALSRAAAGGQRYSDGPSGSPGSA